jgi:hypothetical protein
LLINIRGGEIKDSFTSAEPGKKRKVDSHHEKSKEKRTKIKSKE